MSQFGTPGESGARRRERGFPPRPFELRGIVGELDAPGLTAEPVQPHDQLINEVAAALNLTANAAVGYLNERNAQRRRELDRQAAQDNLNETVWRGEAQIKAFNDLPELLRQISNGDIVPADYSDVPAQVEGILSQRLAGVDAKPYRDAYAKALRGELASALTKAGDARLSETLKRNSAARAVAIANAESEEEVDAALADQLREAVEVETRRGKGTLFSSAEATVQATLLQAAKIAAESGDVEGTKRLTARYAPEHAIEASRVISAAESVRNRANTEAERAATERVHEMFIGLRFGRGTIDGTRDQIERLREDGTISASKALTLHRGLVEIEREFRSAIDQHAVQAQRSEMAAFVRAYMENGATTGGAASLRASVPSSIEIKDPSGRVIGSVKRDDLINESLQAAFSEIDANSERAATAFAEQFVSSGQAPVVPLDRESQAQMARLVQAGEGQDSAYAIAAAGTLARQDAFQKKVDYLNAQGGEATFDQWKALLNGAGYQVASADMTAETVPPIVVQSFELYRKLEQINATGVLARHLTDDGSRALFRTASLYMQQGRGSVGTPGDGGMTMEQALAAASKARASSILRPNFRATISRTDKALVEAAASAAGTLKVENQSLLEEAIQNRAEMYLLMGGGNTNPEAAIKRATNDVLQDYANIDGMAVMVRGWNPPKDINESIVPLVKSYYASTKEARSLGLTEKQLKFSVSQNGVASITDGFNMQDGSPSLGLDEITELRGWMQRVDAAREARRLGTGNTTIGEDLSELANRGMRLLVEGLLPSFGSRKNMEAAFAPLRSTRTPEQKAAAEKILADAETIPPNVSPDVAKIMRHYVVMRQNAEAEARIKKERDRNIENRPFSKAL